MLAGAFEQHLPARVGEHRLGDHEPGAQLGREPQRLLGGPGHRDVVAVVERADGEVADRLLVVDHEHEVARRVARAEDGGGDARACGGASGCRGRGRGAVEQVVHQPPEPHALRLDPQHVLPPRPHAVRRRQRLLRGGAHERQPVAEVVRDLGDGGAGTVRGRRSRTRAAPGLRGTGHVTTGDRNRAGGRAGVFRTDSAADLPRRRGRGRTGR